MKSFWQYIETRFIEAEDIPIPPEVDPKDWAEPSWRKFWLMQNPNYLKQLQGGTTATATAPQQQRVARNLAPVQNTQGASEIDNAIRTYLSRLQGMPNEGSLETLKKYDMGLATAIQKGINDKSIMLHRNRSDTFGFRGVNFFYDRNGKIGFIVNR